MRTSTAFFCGGATVVIAIAAGLGGGLMMANIVSPPTPGQRAEPSRLERRIASEAVAVTTNAPARPVPYLAETLETTAASTTPKSPEAASPDPGTSSAPPSELSAAREPIAPQREKAQFVPNQSPPQAARDEPVDQAEHAARSGRDKAASSQDAFARARETDVRRNAERRHGERRRHWVERYRDPRQDARQDAQRRALELRDVEEKVRQDTEPRFFQVERVDSPRVQFFGADDD